MSEGNLEEELKTTTRRPQEISQALINICKDFQDYFEKEVPEEPMECIQWIQEILEMTREVIEETKESMQNSAETYEKLLQKTEKEVRTHFRIEQQLKLHIDSLQQKIEDFERKIIPKEAAQAKETIEQLKKENAKLKAEIHERNKELKSKNRGLSHDSSGETNLKSSKTNEDNQSSQLKESKKGVTQEDEIIRLRSKLQEKDKECQKLKQENSTLNSHLKQLVSFKNKQEARDNSMIDLVRKQMSYNKQIKPTVKKNYSTDLKNGAYTERMLSHDNSLHHSKDYSARDLAQRDSSVKRKNVNQSAIIKGSDRNSSVERVKSRPSSKNMANMYATYSNMMKPSSAVFNKKKMV